MRLGSMFSGIGLLDLGLERAGFETVFQVENDKRCWPVLERRFPNAERYRDVKTVDWDTVPPVDALAGGFPCQPFSAAGLRKGASDDRYLWPEFARAIRILRPRLVILENVSALLGAPEWGTVLGDLAEAGYDTKWTTVRASDLGAPHKRERVFAVAYASEQPTRGFTGPALGTQEERQDAKGESNCNGSGDGGVSVAYASGPGRRGSKLTIEEGQQAPGCDGSASHPDGARQGRAREELPEEQSGPVGWGTYTGAIRRWERLTRPAPQPTDQKGRLSVQFVEWMMGAPGGYTEGMSRAAALHALGNGVVVQVAEEMGIWALGVAGLRGEG
jgi:DNA (cytosine-5)-methyltransferase 1